MEYFVHFIADRYIYITLFISRSDDGKCNMKKKMVFAATKDTVKKAFEGFQLEIQANEMADLDYSAWKPKVEKS